MIIVPAYEAEQRKKMYGGYSGDMASPGHTELTSVCYEYRCVCVCLIQLYYLVTLTL